MTVASPNPPPRLHVPFAAWLVAALGAGACASGTAEPPADDGPPKVVQPSTGTRVEVAEIGPSAAVLELELPGEVEGGRDALLAAPLGGQVERVLVENGERVKKGQALLRVDSALYGVQLEQARIEREEAEREQRRAERLGAALPEAEREAAATRVERARASERLQSLQLARSVVRAPFDGVVVRVDAEVGEVAPPGEPLARVVQLDPVRVTVSVSDRDVVVLEPGLEGTVRLDARAGLLPARLARIEPAADLDTRAFEVEFEVPNEEGELLPGMIASVRVEKALPEDRLVIPQDFLVTRLDGLGVYLLEDGAARWRPVELGRVVRDRVVVTAGLETGDVVVVVGHRDLADGDRVIVARRGMCCTDGRVRFDEHAPRAAVDAARRVGVGAAPGAEVTP